MEALFGIILGVVIGQAGLLWYKLGRVEQKVKDLCNEVHNNNKSK